MSAPALPRSSRRPLAAAAFTAATALTTLAPQVSGAAPDGPAPGPDPLAVSGVLVPEQEEIRRPSPLLAIPRLTVAVATAPVRGGLVLYERHHLKERVLDLLFDDTRTLGVFPGAGYESGYGLSLGARFVHRNVDGRGARLRLGADLGGHAYRRVDASLGSSDLGGLPLRARLQAGWQRQPNARFYGIGAGDLAAGAAPVVPGPARSAQALETRFRQEVTRLGLSFDLDPEGPLFAGWSASYFDRRFGPTDTEELPIQTGFDVASLPGWRGGSRLLYSELQLGWSSLRAAHPFVSAATPSQGGKLTVFGGVGAGPGRAPDLSPRYLRYGVDALRYFDLFAGDRVLLVRGYLEGVAGSAERIPFTDLPRLGGPLLLRGHDRDRFRDRVALLGSVEYRYPVWRQLGAFMFIDAGRVLPGVDQLPGALSAPKRLRLAGGGGLEIADHQRFHLRGQIAGSSEGVFFQLALEPPAGKGAPHYRI